MSAQTIEEKIALYKNAVQNEMAQSIVLKRLYPTENLTYSDLVKTPVLFGANYHHPNSGVMIGKYRSVPAHHKSEIHKSSWGARRIRKIEIPRKDNIMLFSQTGYMDARINLQEAPVPSNEKFLIVTGITEYYPPPKTSFRRDRQKKARSEKKERTLSFERARKIKHGMKTAAHLKYPTRMIRHSIFSVRRPGKFH